MSVSEAAPSNPYIGPRSFQTGEAIYGRDREIRELLGLLIAERIVLLHSPSGAGKTSLVQAALIPRLQEQEFTVLPVMRVSLDPPFTSAEDSAPSVELPDASQNPNLKPQNSELLSAEVAQAVPAQNPKLKTQNSKPNRYILSLLLSLEEGLPPEQQAPLDHLATLSLAEYLERRPKTGEGDGEVLIFDQFEEILTVDPTDVAAKTAFFTQIGAALRDRHRWALFSMREDYVAALAPYLRSVPTRLSCTYRLDLLGATAAHAAIREPAHRLGVDFADAAASRLIDDLRQVQVQRSDGSAEEQLGPWVEPVQLQVVCYRLWNMHFNGHGAEPSDYTAHIDEADVETVGDVNRALADYYAERVAAVAASTGISERAIREWCDRRLITPQGIRGQVLQAHGQSEGLDNRAIWPLIDAYLVRAEKRRGATWFELAHDRLIEPLREDNIAWRAAHLSALQHQADLWDRQGRPDGLLLRDTALREAEAWANAHTIELTPVEQAFLERCRQVREIVRRARRNNRIIRLLAIVASVISIVAIVAATIALDARARAQQASTEAVGARDEAVRARDDAEQARTEAEHARTDAEHARDEAIARQLAAQSYGSIERTPQRALLLAVEAVTQRGSPHLPAARSALYDALTSAGGMPLPAGDRAITALAFSPDGHTLASGNEDHTVRLWNTTKLGTAPIVLSGHTQPITALAFSPDGRTLATASNDNTARLWDLSRPTSEPVVLAGHTAAVAALAFSPDGRTLATADAKGSTRLWRVAQPQTAPVVLPGGQDPVTVIAFSPDGRILANASDDGATRLWRVAQPQAAPVILPGNQTAIKILAFSPDGRLLATGGSDTNARLWNIDRPEAPLVELEGHTAPLTALAFSPDGRLLASGSQDQTVRLWNLRDPRAVPIAIVLSGHTSEITALAFSAGGPSGPSDSAPPPNAAPPNNAAPPDHARPPNNSSLISASLDGTVRVWDISRPGVTLGVLRGHEGPVARLALSPDGRTLATGGDDRTVRLWNLGSLSSIPMFHDPARTVAALALSPDGHTLATSDSDRTVRLWNLTDPAAGPTVLGEHDGRVNVMVFSPDGHTLATGSNDQTVRLWNLTNPGATPTVLSGHTGGIAALVFNPDGQSLLSASFDGAVMRWNLAHPGAGTTVLSTTTSAGFTQMAFSPDGHYLATDNTDPAALLWDLTNPSAAPAILRGHEQGIGALAFSPNGQTLASGGLDQTVRLWQVANPRAAPKVLRGHTAPIVTMAFSPDGRTLASGSADDTAVLWDIAGPSDSIVLTGHSTSLSALAFSPDGRALVTGDVGGTIRLWPIPEDELIKQACATAGRNLSWDEWQQALGDESYHKTCADLPVSPSLIDAATGLAGGDIQGALKLAQLVGDLGAADEIPARSWGQFCRAGSLAGHAAEVHDACDRAVALAPNDGAVYDSRGLARALTKDTSGAIEDFKTYIAWAGQNGESVDRIAQRQAWVAALAAGRQPFDPATLETLRSE